ncbi:MAG: AAA family ATPase [Candidatus Coproplasma sp.]
MFSNCSGTIKLLASSGVFSQILSFLTSGYAIVVYVIILMVIMALVVAGVLMRDAKSSKNTAESATVSTVSQAVVPVSQPESAANSPANSPAKEKEEAPLCRFEGLCAIDREKESFARGNYQEKITLKRFCDQFRNYSAGELRLYYSESDIRRFISGLLVSHIMILQGMSGTGKTSLAYAFGEFLDNPSLVVPVQPMWKERTDLIGYYNEFTRRFNETDLLKEMYKANYSQDIFITVLDEMNIARVEYYFAEFLSLLELPDAEERNLTVVSGERAGDPEGLDDGHIQLPVNMWFIGTANNDDSTFAISDKVYDRAMIMDLDTKAEMFRAESVGKVHITAERFCELGEEAKREYKITRRNLKRLEELDEYIKQHFMITFGNRIMKQIREYVPIYIACGGDELEALDDILSKKVMRKLGMKNPVHIKNKAEDFCHFMDDLFGEDALKQCKAVVQRLKLNA